MPHAIEEILRWDAPVRHSTFRYTTQDVTLGGTVIPAFAQVIISLAAANRDPARYANSQTLDMTRADTSHLPSATASTTAWAPGWPGSRA